jgi:hypothetical protein
MGQWGDVIVVGQAGCLLDIPGALRLLGDWAKIQSTEPERMKAEIDRMVVEASLRDRGGAASPEVEPGAGRVQRDESGRRLW